MLTAGSSAAVLQFAQSAGQPRFETWRENWARAVLADRELANATKLAACFILWFLNRQSRDCFPSFQTIADGIGIDRRTAIRSVTELEVRGYLQRRSRGKGQSNRYTPTSQVVTRESLGSDSGVTSGSDSGVTLTLEVEPLNITRSRSALCESADAGTKIQKEVPRETCPSGTLKKKAGRGPPALVFEGHVVRVTAEQLECWRRNYSLVPDLMAELRHADDYFLEHPHKDGKWFFRVSAWLKREHDRRLEQKRATDLEDLSF